VRTSIAVLLSFFYLLGPAAAEGEKKEPRNAPPKPLTSKKVADAVVKAFYAKDRAGLKALAQKNEPDPWLVADELCSRGRRDEAQAFSKAAPRADVSKLPAYVEAWRVRASDRKERELVVAAGEALRTGAPERVIADTALERPLDTVVRIRLRHARGVALRMSHRLKASADVSRSGGSVGGRSGQVACGCRIRNPGTVRRCI
jgi:hypothetical protein